MHEFSDNWYEEHGTETKKALLSSNVAGRYYISEESPGLLSAAVG